MVMGNGHFMRLVDQAKDIGAKTISIFGYGEPLLDKSIVEKVEYCTKNGLETFITTNASLLKIDLGRKLLDAGLSHMRFSVHGFYDGYERVHKGLEYATVIRNIANFTADNKIGYDRKCRISITAIPMEFKEIETIKHIWKDFELEIWKPHNWTDGRNYRKLKAKRKKTCGRPHRGPVQINADGLMMVCCYDFNAEMVVGNTYKKTIEEILKSDSFNYIRDKHDAGDLKGLPCETCDQLNIGDNPLLYSTVDSSCEVGKTSSTKFNLEGD
jgi:MoaA/NifB/PqqE/SkfB family radical SAM enzyme